ncbi:MAG TPA: QueT transporter family protein [Candidatus Cryosericum sp.]|nr:QueT transporter family protein [Candidatus Cryosericum sp.]HPS69535.1 QueT transporter family protein [Candidatus Cryosericum sp.]
MKPRTTAQLSRAALIAALYMVLTLVPPFNALSFGAVQFRLGEALVLLPFLLDEAVPGVVAGCLVANFFSPFGLADVVIGTGVTLAAALLTRSLRRTRRAWLAAMPPIVLNAAVVPLYVSTLTLPAATADPRATGIGQVLEYIWSHLSWSVYIPVAATILAGESAVVLLLGLPLLGLVRRYVGPSREVP